MSNKLNISLKKYITDLQWWKEMTTIVIGCVMCAIGFVFFIKYAMNQIIDKTEEKKILKAKAAAEANTQEGGDK